MLFVFSSFSRILKHLPDDPSHPTPIPTFAFSPSLPHSSMM